MITGSQEYEQFLVNLAKPGVPSVLKMRVPLTEKVYEINWNNRTVESPPFIGVSGDHQAEYIFFKMDRFFDTMDLANTIGLIIFRNAHNEEYYQLISYYDTQSEPGKILFPWAIQAPATMYNGKVDFSFKFFRVDSNHLLYEINTVICHTRVLNGWADLDNTLDHTYHMLDVNSLITTSTVVEGINRIIEAGEKLKVLWIDADDDIERNLLIARNTDLLDPAIDNINP